MTAELHLVKRCEDCGKVHGKNSWGYIFDDVCNGPGGSVEVLDHLDAVEAAARFLMDAADQGGELWLIDLAPAGHGIGECPSCGDLHACPGGSRTRIYPPTEGGG